MFDQINLYYSWVTSRSPRPDIHESLDKLASIVPVTIDFFGREFLFLFFFFFNFFLYIFFSFVIYQKTIARGYAMKWHMPSPPRGTTILMLPFNLPIQNVLVDNLASLHLDLPQPYLNPPTTPVLFVRGRCLFLLVQMIDISHFLFIHWSEIPSFSDQRSVFIERRQRPPSCGSISRKGERKKKTIN